ncbi:MFS transporter [Plantactinospora sp. KBS50]|uniref:MFS transporter n=1 Tax=Plantactinospora sp. KBS50 TaxID=2024580 RepID=UPI000BAADA45|nr:MFS transporter [Plantactinospora sp. KBS50]ASW55757.1 hypothetical protein CIK06_18610 [Plantactinospora sp. KBS50]
MILIARNRAFGLLWSSQVLSNVGNWLLVVAVPVFVFQLTGSALSTGLAFVAETAPALVLGPIAGVYVDRWDRRTAMIVVDLFRAAALLALFLVRQPDQLWLLYLIVFAENAAGQFFGPAHRALVPALVGRGPDLDRANAWYSIANGIVRLAGAPWVGRCWYSPRSTRSSWPTPPRT